MSKQRIKQAFQLAGSQHRYQKILILLISLCWVILNFMLLGSTLIFIDPVFHCNQDFEKKVFQKQACPIIDQCQISNVFVQKVQKFTLTSSMQLYCDKEWARDLIQSIYSLGSIIGLLVMNLVSDTKSRKLALLICMGIVSVGILMTTIGGWQNSIPTLIIAQFIQGFGSSSLLPLSYAFLADYCSERLKPRAVIIVNTVWSLSTILIGVFYLVSLEWWVFLLFIMLIPFILVAILFKIFLLESPYVLMLQNKRQEAIIVLQKMTKINSTQHNFDKIKQIVLNQQIKNQQHQASIKNVFKTLKQREFFKPLVIVSLIRVIGCMNFFATSYAFDVQGLGLGYNSMIAGFFQVLSFLFLSNLFFIIAAFINRIPRRKGIAGFYFIVFLIGLLFLFPFVKQSYIVETFLMGTSRIFSTISYTLIASVQTQAFTVQIQSTAVGITQIFGLFGGMFGPLIVDLGDKINVDPVVLIAILVNFAIWPNYFLEETLKPQKNKKERLLQNQDEPQENYNKPIFSQSTIIESEDS